MIKNISISLAMLLMLSACDPAADRERPDTDPQDLFFERLTLLCGKAYPGQLVTSDPQDAEMAEQPMIMHVARCEPDKIEIPFHVSEADDSWNRSRTWVITRTVEGMRLKHRHRHEDGSLDAVTNYGGDSENSGTAGRQEFPVDRESITLFEEQGLTPSVHNVWAVEVSPPGESSASFSYELKRPENVDGRHFKVTFDLSRSIDLPPPAWGEQSKSE